ncbi:MAG: AAA family ATPase [Lachnospiraceae bacterium]|nr:AAA family ATPase [Lachnospiraceae bacterium]
MAKIIFISGPCGCGKTTMTNAYAGHLVNETHKTMYVIHGDDFHEGFKEPEDKGDFFVDGQASDAVHWEDILRFNWDCIMHTAERALADNIDVVIDYVIETEMPRVKALADKAGADLYYIVLTASEEEIERRIRYRGDLDMIERAKFLKRKLDAMPENQGHLLDNTSLTVDEIIESVDLEKYRV